MWRGTSHKETTYQQLPIRASANTNAMTPLSSDNI